MSLLKIFSKKESKSKHRVITDVVYDTWLHKKAPYSAGLDSKLDTGSVIVSEDPIKVSFDIIVSTDNSFSDQEIIQKAINSDEYTKCLRGVVLKQPPARPYKISHHISDDLKSSNVLSFEVK